MRTRLDSKNSAFVTGVRQARIAQADEFLRELRGDHADVLLQAIDAAYVAGPRHIKLVLAQAWEDWRARLFFARQRDLDLLVRFSLERQISRAVEAIGLKSGVRDIVVIVVGRDDAVARCERGMRRRYRVDDTVLMANSGRLARLRRRFNITKRGLNAVPVSSDALAYLLAERSALLSSETA